MLLGFFFLEEEVKSLFSPYLNHQQTVSPPTPCQLPRPVVLKIFWAADHFTKVKNTSDHQGLKSLCEFQI